MLSVCATLNHEALEDSFNSNIVRQASACHPKGFLENPAGATENYHKARMAWYRAKVAMQANDLQAETPFSNLKEAFTAQLRMS